MASLKTPVSVSGVGAEAQLLADLKRQLATLQATLNSGQVWTALTFQTAWENWGSGYQTGKCSIDKFGWVTVMGLVKNKEAYVYNSTNAIISQLPEGMRPGNIVFFEKGYFDGTNHGICRLEIRTNGNIVLTEQLAGTGSSGAAGSWINLTGVRFVAGL
jgi:hypothetical protein